MSLLEKINSRRNKTRKLESNVKRSGRKDLPSDFQKEITNSEKIKKSVETFFYEESLPRLELDSVSYSTMSRETIDKISVCEITNLNKNKNNINTTNDQRLGTIESNILCATCEKSNDECPGHIGILKLPQDIIHPFFRLETMKTLQSVCHQCYSLLLSEEVIRDSGIINIQNYNRLSKIADDSKDGKIRCSNGCKQNPIFKTQKSVPKEYDDIDMYCIEKIGKQEISSHISVRKIKQIFENISAKDLELMGFQKNHPKNFIVNFCPVIPISARPYTISDSQVKEDYITTTYSDILSKKMETFQQSSERLDINEEERKRDECIKRIIFLMNHSIQNCNQEYKRSPSDPCKAINDRITGKDSLIRGNMMGKRVDFSGRTVLGPSGITAFGEIALPRRMQKTLTVPETVTIYNKDYIDNLSNEGKINYFCPGSGRFAGRKLKYDNKKHTLNYGDLVGRHSEEGDIVLFNRQPTLHKNSFLGYRVIFHDKLTLGMHLSSTTGHNADFDGDEGNIHMLQTIDAIVEGKLLMIATNNINMAKSSGPAAGLIFNSITGAYLLTRDDLILSREEFKEGLSYVFKLSKDDYVKKNMLSLSKRLKTLGMKNNYSGRILTSVLFPEDFYYSYMTDDSSKSVKIRNGILLSGQLTKTHIGDSPSTIIQSIFKQYGSKTTAKFISSAAFLFNWYSGKYGLSISLADSKPKKLDEFLSKKREKFNFLNQEILRLPVLDHPTEIEILDREYETIEIIKNTENDVSRLFFQEYLEKDNSLGIMVESKAKGKEEQVKNISAFIGQQFINGQNRTSKSISNGKRWCSTFSVKDNSIYSRGFCENSFFEGMNPDEFLANSQSSRVAMADTALKTATSGFTQKKLTKAQENLSVKYDGTVRNHNNNIYQFNYGAGFTASDMTFSSNKCGMKTRSFINLKELVEKTNTEEGYIDFSLENLIINVFNNFNSKYGSESIPQLSEGKIDIDDLEDFQEVLTFEDENIDFESSFGDLE